MAFKFNFNQFSKQQQKTIIAAVVMLAALTYFYLKFIWLPWSARINEDIKQTRDVEAKIASAQQEARHLELLEKEMETLNLRTVDAEKRLPKTRDMPTVFDTVNRLATKYRVQMTNFAPGAAATKTYFVEISYQLTMIGKYHDIGRFLAAVSTEERIYNIKDVNFTSVAGDEKKLNVTFTLLAYQYRG